MEVLETDDSHAPTISRPTEDGPRLHGSFKRHRTKWFLTGGAIVIFITLTLFWLVQRPSRVGRLSVAVLPFRSYPETPESRDWAGLMSEMIRTELGVAKNLRIIPGEDIAHAATNLSLPPDDGFSEKTLTRIRDFLSADYVVIGLLTRLGHPSELRLDLKVQDAATGDVLASESVTGSESSVFDLAAQCGSLLRKQFGARELAPSEVDTLRQAFPANLQAAKLFVSGLSRIRAFDPCERERISKPQHSLNPVPPSSTRRWPKHGVL